jgi:hypothetical protein
MRDVFPTLRKVSGQCKPTASIMDNEPTVSKNDDLEWGGEFSKECTE